MYFFMNVLVQNLHIKVLRKTIGVQSFPSEEDCPCPPRCGQMNRPGDGRSWAVMNNTFNCQPSSGRQYNADPIESN